ncbi:MAG: DUF6164 family protein [Gammaproteobacteria bacterium]|nr:DUF6164 family protein [Gammaproteobacteria bacterium]
MPALVFSLRNVPEDEADEVRALLSGNDIEFYETSAGNWGISTPAIWLRDEQQFAHARELIDQYQAQRTRQQRERYQQLKHDRQHRTFRDLLADEPLKVIAYIAIVAVILYFSTKPFLDLGN